VKKLLIVGALVLAGCAGSQSQQLLTFCEAHDSSVRALAPQAAVGALTQGQVDAVDRSIVVADGVCTGTVPDFSTALSVMEAELLRMAIIRGEQ